MRTRYLGLPVAFLVAAAAPLAAQDAPEIRVTTRAAEVTIGGRAQVLFSTTNVERFSPAAWELRRVRLELGVRLSDVLGARLQPEFAGAQVGLRDAYVYYGSTPAFQLWVGQAFRPFSLVAQTSSTRILPIERGVRIRGLPAGALDHYNLVSGLGYADRDVGLQVRGAPAGAPLGLTYAFGVFNGPLQGQALDRLTYQLAARVTLDPLPDVRLGAGWSRRDFALVTDADAGALQLRDGNAWEVDLEYGSFAPGLHVIAEAATGDLNPFADRAAGQQTRFRAGQLWAAYRTPSAPGGLTNLEPVLRLSYGDPDVGRAEPVVAGSGGLLLTPGFNLYLGPLNRVMLNYDVWNPPGTLPTRRSFKAQFQIAF